MVYRVGENPHITLWLANEKFERVLWVPTKNSWLFLGRNVISCEMSKHAMSIPHRGLFFILSGFEVNERHFLCAALSRNARLCKLLSAFWGLRVCGGIQDTVKFRSLFKALLFSANLFQEKPHHLILVSYDLSLSLHCRCIDGEAEP